MLSECLWGFVGVVNVAGSVILLAALWSWACELHVQGTCRWC